MSDTVTLSREVVAQMLDTMQRFYVDFADTEEGGGACESCVFLEPSIKALKAALAAPQPTLTYSSTQATKCACCGEFKHTPLRVDFMGGYVCLTCIDTRLETEHDAAAHWNEQHDALLAEQLKTVPQEWSDENVIAWCIGRGLMYAQPEPQPVKQAAPPGYSFVCNRCGKWAEYCDCPSQTLSGAKP